MDLGNVLVARGHLALVGRQVGVDEAEWRITEGESDRDAALVPPDAAHPGRLEVRLDRGDERPDLTTQGTGWGWGCWVGSGQPAPQATSERASDATGGRGS